MDYLPVNLQINNASCLVIGGGSIALRKSRQLLRADANLTLIAPEFHTDLETLATENKITLIRSSFKTEYLDTQLLVIAATNDLDVNRSIYNDALKKRILVNTVDQPELCQFIMPAVIDRSPLTIAISSSGVAPVFARMLREKFEWFLPKNIGELLFHLKGKRSKVKEKYPQLSERRYFWERYFEKILNWSTRDNVNINTPQELDLDKVLNIFLEEQTAQKLINQLTIVHIQSDGFSAGDLTINNLKALQKADEVYLTSRHYALLENLIRRDAELNMLDSEMNSDAINNVKENQSKNIEATQIVIVKNS